MLEDQRMTLKHLLIKKKKREKKECQSRSPALYLPIKVEKQTAPQQGGALCIETAAVVCVPLDKYHSCMIRSANRL